MVLETYMFNHKIISMGIIIPYNPYLFTLLGTCVLSHFKLQLLATCFLYISVTSQQMLIHTTCTTVYPMHMLQIVMLSFKITPESSYFT